MLIAEKPPLDEELLAHYGIKGMRWGRRKAELPVAPKPPRKKWSTKKKVAVGAAVVAGYAFTVGYLRERGQVKPKFDRKNIRASLKRTANAMKPDNESLGKSFLTKTDVWLQIPVKLLTTSL